MKDTFVFTNLGLFLGLWLLGLLLFYLIIKVAVRNGVRDANVELLKAVKEISGKVEELKRE